jgi:YidC/Oxa1 family membrane protein insertase
MDDQNKNLILATALSFLVILTWVFLFPPETPPVTDDPAAISAEDGALAVPADSAAANASPDATVAEAAPEAPRLTIDTPRLTGTISLQGGRIDDLKLSDYRETIDPDSDLVRLLTPAGEDFAYYALFGWRAEVGLDAAAVPGPDTLWSVDGNETLTPDAPVTLVWDNGAGQIFRRQIAIDTDYMFTLTQSVENTTGAEISLSPYGLIARQGRPDAPWNFILHEGVVRMSDGELQEIDYGDMPDLETVGSDGSVRDDIAVTENGWIGFTDKYWMATIVPQPGQAFTSTARYLPTAGTFQTLAFLPAQTVAPGATATVETHLFAGAKEWEAIRHYQNDWGIDRFIDSIDWGWFFFLTKPMFWLLHNLHDLIGNMGWAIIALTLVIKVLVLPLAYKSYVSMAKMKELQPEMEKLKERAGEDRQALQQGMMKLYKDNKVNPAAGCLPILIQIPIFFALYKVIFVTIELRHAEWIGWIRDLSAPDPSSILNLFGLLPWSTPEPGSLFFIFSLGVLPIILGISMWLQQKLNPAPTDATQKMVFAWMPWIFMFMLGSFASGLVLYWIANNTITFIQQYTIMRSHGHKPDVFGNMFGGLTRKKAAANDPGKPGGK